MAQLEVAPAGITQTYVPKPPLRNFVDLIWQYDGLVLPHDFERVLPTGTMGIIFNLAEDQIRIYEQDPHVVKTLPGGIVFGPYSRYFVIDTAEQASVLGVSFSPGGAAPFLLMPAAEARDMQLSVEDVWGTVARYLRDRLLEASPAERFRVMEDWLLERAKGALTRHPAVAYALTEFSGVPHTRTVSEVTDQVGLSSRRFIEVFDSEVGLTPKLFCRIQRFQHAIRIAHQGTEVNWADLAAMSGYYDQSHMIRDFEEFSGLSPSAYLKDRGPHLNHIPLPS